ncbi:4Fe-4S binding protein [Pelotomaculum terephthalicicum JT]|uniref:4Fe-4S dicluster domain-containing protein n=1 Tax=Pelotomaculum TaxID=191373 RepID=UPI0009C79248|nr:MULTISPECIES: 4Fe-4S binding protein [Pelotomaculum]MCG9967337.1 4Fe-4S binding protein [Pelotomaculum terephthalicicum JT]OPX90688.1 MAG: NADH dehydrogenase subunit I [Pelotomaculum sp. PtaB.Bin117]OPY61312.1 MAG: NADH dehydrogenase subunit I [Pelotomaculum sp. PtaU1.Bin065]
MGHIANDKEEVYMALAERLHKNPVGAPVNEVLMEILHRLYTEGEAMVGSKFPMVPIRLNKIAAITGIKEETLKETLDSMSDKGLVQELPAKKGTYYMLTPMVVGFFEFTFMRVRDEIKNMRELAELFERYFRRPEVGEEFTGTATKLMKALVYESLIPAIVETEVLSYEKASEIIRQSGRGALSLCACRHKASHLGRTCDAGAPMETCTTLGDTADWLVSRGMARPAAVDELLQVLDQTEKLGLVHLGDNVLNQPAYLCHCCGCCCEALRPTRKHGKLFAHPSNFIPALDQDGCSACGTCADSCQIKVITMRDDGSGVEVPEINKETCIGCGVCASACPNGALTMSRRPVLHVPPKNKMELFTRIAREKGKI